MRSERYPGDRISVRGYEHRNQPHHSLWLGCRMPADTIMVKLGYGEEYLNGKTTALEFFIGECLGQEITMTQLEDLITKMMKEV